MSSRPCLETVQSRLAAFPYPRGVSGRLHTVRLRRCFRTQEAGLEASSRGLHSSARNQRSAISIIATSSSHIAPQTSRLSQLVSPKTVGRFLQHEQTRTRTSTAHKRDDSAFNEVRAKWAQLMNEEASLEKGLEPAESLEIEIGQDATINAIRDLQPDELDPLDARMNQTDLDMDQGVNHTDVNEELLRGLAENADATSTRGDLPLRLDDVYYLRDPAFVEDPQNNPLVQVLKEGDPRIILKTALAVCQDQRLYHWIQKLPETTFTEVLKALDPAYFLGRYNKLFQEMSFVSMASLGSNHEQRQHYKAATLFLSHLMNIITVRQETGTKLGRADYKHLLKCARYAGDTSISGTIWRAMHGSKVAPDLECYTHYLGSKCLRDLIDMNSRLKLHVNPREAAELAVKVQQNPDTQTGLGRMGLRVSALKIFDHMISRGISADEEMISFLLISMARDGAINEVGATIERVWGVNVDQIMEAPSVETEPAPARIVDRTSPYYPTERLLWALAHCYGINNQMNTALRIVDYVARHYKLEIPSSVWDELLQRVYVICHPHSFRRAQLKKSGAHVEERDTFVQFWKIMTSPPYNVQPSLSQYNRLIRNLAVNKRFHMMRTAMDEASILLRAAEKRVVKSEESLTRHIQQYGYHPLDPEVERLLAQHRYNTIQAQQFKRMAQQWMRYYFQGQGSREKPSDEEVYCGIPRLVLTFRKYLASSVEYDTPTGHLKVDFYPSPATEAQEERIEEDEFDDDF